MVQGCRSRPLVNRAPKLRHPGNCTSLHETWAYRLKRFSSGLVVCEGLGLFCHVLSIHTKKRETRDLFVFGFWIVVLRKLEREMGNWVENLAQTGLTPRRRMRVGFSGPRTVCGVTLGKYFTLGPGLRRDSRLLCEACEGSSCVLRKKRTS